MSRRSSRKVTSLPAYTEVDEYIDILSEVKVEETTPKNSRKVMTEEQVEVTAQSIKASPKKQVNPKQGSKVGKFDDTVVHAVGTDAKVKKSPAKRKVNPEEPRPGSENTGGAQPTEVISPNKTKIKRKIEVEKEIDQVSTDKSLEKTGKRKVEEEEVEEQGDTKKVKRKRKTQEEKEAEAMPLAARTSIQTLQRAMYIGAHVSGAGGKFFFYPRSSTMLEHYCFPYTSSISIRCWLLLKSFVSFDLFASSISVPLNDTS
jgi:hypothetical protein